jgi:DNA mismatch repair protein MSH4
LEKVVDELISKVREHLGVIHSVSDSISMLDLFYSFASWVSLSEILVRPEMSENGPIAIKQGVHPLMAELQDIDFVPNDTYISSVNNFFMISGQNNSGKSTYIKQVGILTLLAHIGSYVPAAWASFRLTDCIFSRIGTDDDMEHNSSTFLVEMREVTEIFNLWCFSFISFFFSFLVANILQNTTRRSLVLIDELGRGTSTLDGLGLAWSICEYLLSIPCFTLFTTHFAELQRLARLYPNVKTFCLAADASHCPTFVLAEGAAPESGYGLRAAFAAGLPDDVVARAGEIKAQMAERRLARGEHAIGSSSMAVCQHVADKILSLKNSTLDQESIREFLRELKQSVKEL